MVKGIAANLDGIFNRFHLDVPIPVRSNMQQSGNPKHQPDILASPFPHVAVFIAEISLDAAAKLIHSVYSFWGKVQCNRSPFKQMKNQIVIIFLYSCRNRCGLEGLWHGGTGNIDVEQPCQKAASIQQTVLHNFAQNTELCADNHGQCRISDVIRLSIDAIHTDGITADTFQPHIEVRLLRISPDDVVKRSSLSRDERHASMIIFQQSNHGFTGAVIGENLPRLDFRQFCQLVLCMLQF